MSGKAIIKKTVFISVWSNPWEHDKKTGAKYHVENDTFGDNYQEQ